VGKISKALFGTMDDEDAQFYHDQIAGYYRPDPIDETATDDRHYVHLMRC
jgi:hypothetical protein